MVRDGAGKIKVHYRVSRNPLVSIIIPTKDRWDMLRQCIKSVESVTRYPSYEIVVVDNGSRTAKAKEYLSTLSKNGSSIGFRDRLIFPRSTITGPRKRTESFSCS
ncbi:MAG: glycosyltransferase [Nitrospira sp.]|nr:glycosyltransferase [Nitrospira sp.]